MPRNENKKKRKRNNFGGMGADKRQRVNSLTVCRDFIAGICEYGTACRFSHSGADDDVSVAATTRKKHVATAPPACFNFQKGKCKRGDKCRFSHNLKEGVVVGVDKKQTEATELLSKYASTVCAAETKLLAPKPVVPVMTKFTPTASTCAITTSTTSTTSTATTTSSSTDDGEFTSKKSFMTNSLFSELSIDSNLKRAIKDVMKYDCLTRVQDMSMPTILKGCDVLAQAKTGTGKTLGFLIPAMQQLLLKPVHHGKFGILILSSTRELASQIAVEATKLCHFTEGTKIICFVGGTNIEQDKRKAAKGASILVATPGRLLDHFQNTNGFATRFDQLRVLILDEADQLLEMGFQPDIKRIVSYLPNKKTRQNLLFSATVPKTLLDITSLVMDADHAYINCIPEGEEHTHMSVPQYLITHTMEETMPVMISVIQGHIAAHQATGYKIIVFFTTARICEAMAGIAMSVGIPNVLEIHSRKNQSYRTKVSDKFRKGKNMVLFSSDVSARGVDYPDVSLVFQVGLTSKEQYIHRIGRTARGSGSVAGVGILLLTPWEQRGMKKDISALPTLKPFTADMESWIQTKPEMRLQKAIRGLDKIQVARVYQAWLGFNNMKCKAYKWSKIQLVEYANRFAKTLGGIDASGCPPALNARTAGKMGLRGVKGLNIN